MVILLFKRGTLAFVRRNNFLWYCLLVFLFNIIPYWTSPEAYARYILMLVPLFMTILFALYFEYQKSRTIVFLLVDYIFGAFIGVIAIGCLVFIFHPLTRDFPFIALVSVLTMLALGIISFFYWKQPVNRLLWLAISLLLIRITFDLTIIPSWEKTHPVVATKQLAADLARETADKQLYVYWNPEFEPDPYFSYRYNNEIFTFYLSTARGEITRVKTEKIPGALYLAQWEHVKDASYIPIKKIAPAWQVPVMLIEFKEYD
jgi:hypothetical protein